MKLCSLCRTNHEENHIIVDQGLVNYICKIHGKTFVSYCQICQNNLCILCEKDHDKDHNITDFRKMIPNYNVRQKLNEFRELIDKFIDNIKSIIDKLNSVINNIEIYYRINNDIINCYERKYKNYQIYKNIQNIEEYNRLVIEDIKNIINDNYEINKFNYIYEMYNLMNKKKVELPERSKSLIPINDSSSRYRSNSLNNNICLLKSFNTLNKNKYIEQKEDITIEYKIPKNAHRIMILGSEFIKNNRNRCEIYINGKYRELSQNIDLNTCQIENGILEIKFRPLQNLTNLSSMFSGCVALYSLPDFNKLVTNNVIKMNNLFNMCESLKSISDISKWDISKVIDLSYMFYGCKSLLSLPDISHWNTSNAIEIRNLFSGCKSLKYL